jgi:hypothetical protein
MAHLSAQLNHEIFNPCAPADEGTKVSDATFQALAPYSHPGLDLDRARQGALFCEYRTGRFTTLFHLSWHTPAHRHSASENKLICYL